MNFTMPPIGLGTLIALLVVVVTLVLFLVNDPLTKNETLGLIGALAVARILP